MENVEQGEKPQEFERKATPQDILHVQGGKMTKNKRPKLTLIQLLYSVNKGSHSSVVAVPLRYSITRFSSSARFAATHCIRYALSSTPRCRKRQYEEKHCEGMWSGVYTHFHCTISRSKCRSACEKERELEPMTRGMKDQRQYTLLLGYTPELMMRTFFRFRLFVGGGGRKEGW